MSRTTRQALGKFLEDITTTEFQRTSSIPSRKKSVDAKLLAKFPSTSDMPYAFGILMGSASKGTIIRPLDDIDVLAVFSNVNRAWDKYRNDSHAFIYRIRDAYSGTLIQHVGTRGQSVRVFYETGGHVDVAPVFSRGDGVYHLPDGTGGWILTAPTIAKDWFDERHSVLGYRLAPLVRLAKAWNRAHSMRMRSFHLETVTANMFNSLGENHRSALQRFFEWAPNWLDVNDPGKQGGPLGGYLTWSARQELLTALSSAADRARRANEVEARGDHDEAKRLWRITLGPTFPN